MAKSGKDPKKKKAIIFAEAPVRQREYYGFFDDDLPDDLLPLQNEYYKADEKYAKSLEKSNELYSKLQNYRKGWFGSEEMQGMSLKDVEDDPEINKDPSYLRYKKQFDDNRSRMNSDLNNLDKAIDRFYTHQSTKMPESGEVHREKTFITEGDKLKSFYGKQGIDAEVVPVYEQDSSLIKKKLQSINPGDDVALFGHSGDQLAGLPLGWWNENISGSEAENCYLGSCNAENTGLIEDMGDIKNLHHTVGQPWKGVNPRGDDTVDAMYSVMGHDTISPQPIKGKDFNVSNKLYARGGNVMASKCGTLRKRKMQTGGIIEDPPVGGQVGVKKGEFKAGWPVGTPLKDIYNVPSDLSPYAQKLSSRGTRNAMNRMRWANYTGEMQEYPEGTDVPSFHFTPEQMQVAEEKGLSREYIDSWQPDNYPEEFGFGGWLKENAGLIGGIAGTALAGPLGGAVGSLLGSGVSAIGGNKEADELAEDFTVPQGLAKQHYQRAAGGGKLTKFKGPRHEDGGVALGGMPVEVEGGETRTNDMIHSDRIKITPAMIKKYPVLKKSDKGKTMAQITENVHKKFEKRKWDELNDNAAEIAMLPYEQISDELSQEQNPQVAAGGGDISALKARKILSHGAVRGKPITDNQRRFFGSKTKAAGGLNMKDVGKFAPLVASGADLIGSLIQGPEEVDYGRTSFTPTKVNFASAEPGVQRIRRTFGNAESKLRRLNPNRYLARMGELAANEADAVTDYAGGIQRTNVEAQNRANITDAQGATRTNFFNKQTAIREAEANAANRGAHRTRISANVSNMGTMAGQMARDERLQESSDAASDRYFNILEEQNRILGGYGDVGLEDSMEDIATNVAPLSSVPKYPFADGGNLRHRLRLKNLKTA